MENQVIKDQTLQGSHYVIMGFRALKLLSEGFGGVKPCNHQYRGCHLKNPTDITRPLSALKKGNNPQKGNNLQEMAQLK